MLRFVLVLAICQAALAGDYDRYSGAAYSRGADSDRLDDKFKFGARRDNLEKYRLPMGISAGVHHIDLPENFDAREKWSQCPSLRAIRDQACCGSCWAVSAASTMTDRWCIHHTAHPQFLFGSFDLLGCCHSCGDGCEGGWLGPAWNFWVSRGISSGGPYNSHQGCHSYPFNECPPGMDNNESPTCAKKCQSSYNVTDVNEDRRFGRVAYAVANDEERIREEIYLNGPVQVSFDVYSDFKPFFKNPANKAKVYRHTKGYQQGGHAVKVVGWGVQEGTKFWLIANSWGAEWGDNGYFRMVRGENHLGIEADVNAGLPHYNKRKEFDF